SLVRERWRRSVADMGTPLNNLRRRGRGQSYFPWEKIYTAEHEKQNNFYRPNAVSSKDLEDSQGSPLMQALSDLRTGLMLKTQRLPTSCWLSWSLGIRYSCESISRTDLKALRPRPASSLAGAHSHRLLGGHGLSIPRLGLSPGPRQ